MPLSRQALAILEELREVSGGERFVFYGRKQDEPRIHSYAPLRAIRSLGYASGEHTFHGFRSMASTLLNELGWNRDAIERQLAHGERNKIRAAYNHAEFLPERRKMMQAWADYLEQLRERNFIC